MDAQNDRQTYELNYILQIDTTTISTDETNEYYIINTKWLENWIDYVQHKTASRPGLIFNEILMDNDDPNGKECKSDLIIKIDYRLVNFNVWKQLSTWYGVSGPTISIISSKVANFTDINTWRIEVPANQQLLIKLVPHEHSLKSCNRKQFVCDTAGTYREREKVMYCAIDDIGDENTNDISWYRGKMREKYNFSSIAWEKCVADDNNRNNKIYEIKLRDYNYYLKVKSNRNKMLESNVVGPCDIQTPFCQDVLITGNPTVGNVLKAKAIYWGGIEGPSEYSWIRLVKGKREKFATKAINPSIPFDDLTDDMTDIRCYKLTDADIGTKIKVQISPIRSDGLRGESKTSKACIILDTRT
jgi:hypothetical protein